MTRIEKIYSILFTIFGFIWIVNGLIINLIQFICYVVIYPINKSLYRKINYYLIYSSWSQIVALAENWCNCKLTICWANEESEKLFGREHCVALLNHKYEIDWLYCWLVADKLQFLGSAKSFAKKSLRWMPVVGWTFFFSEMIFLARNWAKDSLTIGECLDKLTEYSDNIVLLLFAEGTRFTKEKYEASVKFAKEKGLHILKHHLQPRTKGFVFTIQRAQKNNKIPAIYNIQLAFQKNVISQPTLMSLSKGNSIHGYLYVQRLPIKNLPRETDELIDYLYDLYKKKDDLMDYFYDKGTFPGKEVTLQKTKTSLANLIFWYTLTLGLFSYFLNYLWLTKNVFLLSIIALLILIVIVSFFLLVGTTKANKGSAYGKSHELSENGKKLLDESFQYSTIRKRT